ncbi:hypothetical protein GCM10009603_05030 [Nocardiopsis exhalans]
MRRERSDREMGGNLAHFDTEQLIQLNTRPHELMRQQPCGKVARLSTDLGEPTGRLTEDQPRPS